ncbi:uncharacterized protein Pyn_40241 [Prunus yedoensis var. nudiflora]|uniref:Uncharacterized protein n=1 Tax=Prunus yedoensis var. nudiflora TaxID=2094558 RepID=A0A314XR06_PRUYE|nr:uncharacterized protein Pyn_40241 [Prunus yedoensis var. nudiflora]
MQAASGPLISLSPSFNTYSSSDRLAQIAARVVSELTSQDHQLTHDEPDWEKTRTRRLSQLTRSSPTARSGPSTLSSTKTY